MNRQQHTSPFYFSIFPGLVILLCFPCSLLSQSDTLGHSLDEVVVQSDKFLKFNAGKKTQTLDSATLALYNSGSLAEVLSGQSSMHIKSYGNGNIATTSFRGGNASQTAVVWNGINIQNNMLGQSDLSLINAMLFDNISLEFGGGSAMWGSGAMSGVIHLGNKPVFNQGVQTKVTSSFGSFNTVKLNTAISLSYKKMLSNTKVYYTSSDNNYQYKDTTDRQHPNKQVSHANYVIKGLMQEFSFLAGNYQKVNLRAWYNEASRNLPSYTEVQSKQSQFDQNLKLNADWNYQKKNYSTTVRGAYLYDVLNYTDSLAGLFSKSNSSTIVAENEHMYRYKAHVFDAGLNYTCYEANTDGYAASHHVNKAAVFLSYKWQALQDKLVLNVSARQEFSSQFKIPLTGNIGANYGLSKSVSLKLNAAKSFRQPTLNDLYWAQGGNPNLKPEQAIGFEGGIAFNKTVRQLTLYAEGTYFNRHTTNWIIWLPQANYSSPRNIAEVYSRGTETNFSVKYGDKDFSIKLSGSTAYVLSTSEKTQNENDNSKGRQLIYTPRYTLQGGLLISLQNFSLLYNQSYTGYRFTSTDNTAWLTPYSIATLKASYSVSISQVKLQTFFSFNNLFNHNYQVVANRPMPLRNYEAGISIMYNNKTKK